MKTCRLSASSFVSLLQFFKSSARGYCELLAYFDVKVASLMLRTFIMQT